MTPAYLRPLAEADLIERTRYYASKGGRELGERFFASALASIRAMERMPGAGSPQPGESSGIEGLRARRIEGFPCGWYYFTRSDRLDVVRLLADAQDLPDEIARPG